MAARGTDDEQIPPVKELVTPEGARTDNAQAAFREAPAALKYSLLPSEFSRVVPKPLGAFLANVSRGLGKLGMHKD